MGTLRTYHRRPLVTQRGTPILTLYGGPGTGKSTTAAMLFAAFKQRGDNVELAHEVAKDYTWEGADAKLLYQPYVIAKQLWRYERLQGKVDLIITDTSSLLGLVYGHGQPGSFEQWLLDDYRRRKHINIFLRRNPLRPYNPHGRRQTQEEAEALDTETYDLLDTNGIDHYEVIVGQFGEHVPDIIAYVDSVAKW